MKNATSLNNNLRNGLVVFSIAIDKPVGSYLIHYGVRVRYWRAFLLTIKLLYCRYEKNRLHTFQRY